MLLTAALCLALETRPDLVLVLADDLGEDALRDTPTPELDAFARESVRFTSWYTQTNCSPTRVMILTGSQPLPAFDVGTIIAPKLQNPDPDTNPSLPTRAFLLPEALKSAGYATGFFGKWHVSNEFTIGQMNEAPRVHGFDNARAARTFGVGQGYGGGTEGVASYPIINDGNARQTLLYNTTEIVDSFLDWWAETPAPRFAFVAFNAPHAPFHTPPAGLYPPGMPTSTDRQKFLAMVAALDTEFGRLVAGLDPQSTVVAFAGDNGTPEDVAPPRLAGKVKGSMYDGGVSPPLFVRGPWFRPREETGLASATDLFATFTDLAGYRGSVPADSLSLFPNLVGEAPLVRETVVAAFRVNGTGPFSFYRRMIFDGERKLILEEGAPPLLLGPGDDPNVPQDPEAMLLLAAELAEQGF